MKRLTDRFEGRATVGGEIRIIPRPLFEYHDTATDLPIGAIFGLASTGTNPSGLLLIEARHDPDGELRWEYAAVHMSTSGMSLNFDDMTVCQRPGVANSDNVQDNWTFYFMLRGLDVPSN
jgi:hypothetical protein